MKPVTAKPPVSKDEEDDAIIIMRKACRQNTLIAAALGILVGFLLGLIF